MVSRLAQGVAIGNIKNAPRKFLAFCDVLGMRQAILEDFENVGSLYFDLIKMLRLEYTKLIDEIEVSIFSDSIVMVGDNLIQLIYATHALSEACMRKGFIIRGGISYGRHYEDPNQANWFTVSEALVKAAALEATTKLPRIELDPELGDCIEALPLWLDLLYGNVKDIRWMKAFELPLLYEHKCDVIGKSCIYVNPFSPGETVHLEARKILLEIKTKFTDPNDYEIVKKYDWLITLHDRLRQGQIYVPEFVRAEMMKKGGRTVMLTTEYSLGQYRKEELTYNGQFVPYSLWTPLALPPIDFTK